MLSLGRKYRRKALTPLEADVTNIDPEHLDHYGDFAGVRAAFRQFVENVPFYGFAVMCLDHPEVQTMIGTIEDRRVVSYGANPQADVRFTDVSMDGGKSVFSVTMRDRRTGQITEMKDLMLPMPGLHNVSNATAAIAVASQLGVGVEDLRRGLASFGGVKRRFTHTGTVGGVQIFDDYGHHPVEIKAVLHAARESTKGKVIAVMQPHRYTRLHSLFDDFSNCFNDADAVLIAPVYAAGEQPIEGAAHTDLVSGMKTRGHRPADTGMYVPSKVRKNCLASSAKWPGPVISSSVLARATSPSGPTLCRNSSKRSKGPFPCLFPIF